MKSLNTFKTAYADTLRGFSAEDIIFIRQHFGNQMSALKQVLDAIRRAERKTVLKEIAEQEQKKEEYETREIYSSAQADMRDHMGTPQ